MNTGVKVAAIVTGTLLGGVIGVKLYKYFNPVYIDDFEDDLDEDFYDAEETKTEA